MQSFKLVKVCCLHIYFDFAILDIRPFLLCSPFDTSNIMLNYCWERLIIPNTIFVFSFFGQIMTSFLLFGIACFITINIEHYESLFDQPPPKEAIRSHSKISKGNHNRYRQEVCNQLPGYQSFPIPLNKFGEV